MAQEECKRRESAEAGGAEATESDRHFRSCGCLGKARFIAVHAG